MAVKNFSGQPLQGAGIKKVRPCKLCNDTGRIRVWRLDENGKRYSVDEVCACQNWGK